MENTKTPTAPTPNAPAGELTQVLPPEIASALAQVRRYVANTMTCPCGFGEERSRKEPCACSFGGIQNGLSDLEEAIVPYLAARRDADALAEWNAMLDEAAPQDVKAFADKTNGDLAETLRWMRRYVPTGFHALLNATIDRLLAARREVEARDNDLEYAWAIIANAGHGNWTLESAEWQVAAAKWRDQVMPGLSARAALAATPEEKND